MSVDETVSAPKTLPPEGVHIIVNVMDLTSLTCNPGEEVVSPSNQKIDGRIINTRKKDIKNKTKLDAVVASGARERFGDERVSQSRFSPRSRTY